MLDRTELRHRCRRCRGKLPEPTTNEHSAFCCSGCWRQFYRTKCAVCEKKIEQPKKGTRVLCTWASCKSAMRRFPHTYKPFDNTAKGADSTSPLPGIIGGKSSEKSVDLTGAWNAHNDDRPWLKRPWHHIAGPKLSSESFAAATSFDKFTWASFQKSQKENLYILRTGGNPNAIFQKSVPPLNILGGYKFPGAPKLDAELIRNIKVAEGLIEEPPSLNVDRLLADDGHPSGIPAFLRRAAI